MFSKELLSKKNNVNNEQKIKKLKNLKSGNNCNLSATEQINSFAEIIVNNLLKNYKNEN